MEVKFRGKRVIDNQWVYGNLVKLRKRENNDIVWVDAIQTVSSENGIHSYNTEEVYSDSVSQFTGFVDKNSKEIYLNSKVNLEEVEHIVEWVQDLGRIVLACYVDGELFDEVLMIEEIAEECELIEE